MKILVIGNGFDLEHGLPTKYKDFFDFMQGIKLISSKASSINEQAFIEELEKTTKHEVDENVKKYLTQEKFLDPDSLKKWKDVGILKELIECAEKNILIKYFWENLNQEDKGWIDFESEISNVIESLDSMKKLRYEIVRNRKTWSDKDFEKEDTEFRIAELIGCCDKINVFTEYEYNKNVIQVITKYLNNLIRCLEIYLEDCVGKIELKYISPDIKEIEFDKILSFNYTNTYERIYAVNNEKLEYHYIHGKANVVRDADENNMVLGIDEYLDIESKNKELEFIAFKKYFQRIYKKTGNVYKKWILEMENIEYESTGECNELGEFETQKIKNEIYIFGHSLDVTDKDILKELIECENTQTTIFYYNKDVYAQQIANLVKVIGQDELIKRVSGANPTIIFKQQQKRMQRN